MVPKWIYGAMIALVMVHFVTAYVLRVRNDLSPDASSAVSDRRRIGDDTVECAECGAENERGYRFCRLCVSVLPGSVVRTHLAGAERTRRIT